MILTLCAQLTYVNVLHWILAFLVNESIDLARGHRARGDGNS